MPARKPGTEATDARDPNTVQDKSDIVEPLNPADVDAAALDPETYGIHTIDTAGAAEAYRTGPGVAPPERVQAAPQNSTFAERAAARQKVVGLGADTVTAK